jgi:hypothetical protein
VVHHQPAAHLTRELDVVVGQVESLVDAQRTRVDDRDQRRVAQAARRAPVAGTKDRPNVVVGENVR